MNEMEKFDKLSQVEKVEVEKRVMALAQAEHRGRNCFSSDVLKPYRILIMQRMYGKLETIPVVEKKLVRVSDSGLVEEAKSEVKLTKKKIGRPTKKKIGRPKRK